ncbi:MAG: hypothetical protein JST16_05255 [Bdellovibrionales bacterium]|nr:hypothetical protein [Bdellovibrionales bacterium]
MSKAKKEKAKTKEQSKGGFAKNPFAPKIEDSVTRSKDGRWIISKVTITSIKPARYYEKMLSLLEAKASEVHEPSGEEPQV